MADAHNTDEIIHRLRIELAKRGEASIRTLSKTFLIADSDNNKTLGFEEFDQVMNKCGLFLTHHEASKLKKVFDKNKDERVDYEEFLLGLQGSLNDRRLAMVVKAFEKFDVTGDGIIDSEDMKKTYDASQHAKVKIGERSEEQVMKTFLDSFEGAGGNKDGKVTKDEFIQYYTGISASIPYNDDYFCQMMENAWKIKESGGEKERISQAAYLEQVEQILREKVRQKTFGSETGETTLKKTFKWFDLDDCGYVDFKEWDQALERFGVRLSPQDSKALFAKYDDDKSGRVNYKNLATKMFV
eukprot:128149_1